MKQITIEITKNQIEEILPIILLQMHALESGKATLAQLEALNGFSPVLMDIQESQKSNTLKFEQFLSSVEDMEIEEEKLEELTEEREVLCIYPKELSLEKRITYATLFMGELSKIAQKVADPLEALAWVAAGVQTFSEFTDEDYEVTQYWIDLGQALTPILEESIEKNEEEFPILCEGARMIGDAIKEYYEEQD